MATDFLIFRDHQFAHRTTKSDNYVCYRTVICHALFWKMNHSQPEDASNAFKAFVYAVNNSVEHEDSTFLSLFICQMRGLTGYILVDKSRGYYPLVAYPFKNMQGASRAEALRYAVNDLNDNLSVITSLLSDEIENRRDWSLNLQQRLQNDCFHYKEDEDIESDNEET